MMSCFFNIGIFPGLVNNFLLYLPLLTEKPAFFLIYSQLRDVKHAKADVPSVQTVSVAMISVATRLLWAHPKKKS